MENSKNYLIVFDSQNHAYFLESLFIRKGFEVDYFQAPKYLTHSCCASLKVKKEALRFAGEMIKTFKLEVYRIYKCCKTEGKITYRVVKI